MGVWTEDLKAKRTMFRGIEYDSQLEADWSASLTMWGIEFIYHPGRIYLETDVYEPDFQLDGDILLEVKGPTDDRLWKALDTERTLGIPVIIGRGGFIPAGSDEEHAGAVWEPSEWVLSDRGSGFRFERFDGVDEYTALWTAHMAYARDLPGIRFFKAVGDRCV